MKRSRSPPKDPQDRQKLARVLSEEVEIGMESGKPASVATAMVENLPCSQAHQEKHVQPIDAHQQKEASVLAVEIDNTKYNEDEVEQEEQQQEELESDEGEDTEQRSLTAHLIKENELGITEYRTPQGNGFTAILKER